VQEVAQLLSSVDSMILLGRLSFIELVVHWRWTRGDLLGLLGLGFADGFL
jgi:hypothetical protein